MDYLIEWSGDGKIDEPEDVEILYQSSMAEAVKYVSGYVNLDKVQYLTIKCIGENSHG